MGESRLGGEEAAVGDWRHTDRGSMLPLTFRTWILQLYDGDEDSTQLEPLSDSKQFGIKDQLRICNEIRIVQSDFYHTWK